MAGVFSNFLRQAIIGGELNTEDIDLLTMVVRVVLYDHQAGAPSLTTDVFRSDLTGVDIIATSTPLLSKTMTALAFDAADINVASVSGDQFESGIITCEPVTGAVDGNTILVALLDSGTGLPFTPSGAGIDITWNGSGIFTL